MNACARPSGFGLLGVGQSNAPIFPVAEKSSEERQTLRIRNDQNIADAREHERRQRIVDHRLVVDGEKLFRHGERHRVEPRAAAAGENDPLHLLSPNKPSISMMRSTHNLREDRHSGNRTPWTFASLVQLRRELTGRFADCG